MTSTFVPLRELFTYETVPERYTREAVAYFAKGDVYEINGRKDWARGCDRKALRKLEASFRLRNIDRGNAMFGWRHIGFDD